MAQSERPAIRANPGSTGALPTSRLMQLMATSLGRTWSKSVRFDGGPRTQPQVAKLNGGAASFQAWTAMSRSVVTALIAPGGASSQVQPSHVQCQ